MTSQAIYPTLPLLYEALQHPLGIWVRTPDPDRLKALLRNAKREQPDPAFDGLQIRTPPNNPHGELWIVRAPRPTGQGPTERPPTERPPEPFEELP